MRALHTLGARRIAEGVRAREFSARMVARRFLERTERFDGELRAFVDLDAELVLAAADRVDRRQADGLQLGPLAGVPVAVKDNLCLRGLPTTCGSHMLAAWRPPYDADAVERLLAADAIPFGKTNLDEFGMGSSTEWSAFGPTRNPWDPERVPGGSSGGSAAAVAAGLAPLALGSDTGGSVRQPAAYCGVFGMAPTYGRISRRGLVAFASSLDRVGAFARRADDLAVLIGVLSGGDAGDATSLHETPPDWPADVASGVRDIRVGVLTGTARVEPETAASLDAAVAALGAAGATVREAVLAGARDALSAYHLLAAAEASSNLARYDGVRFGPRPSPGARDAESAARDVRARGFGPEVRRRLVLGTLALSAGHRDELHARATATRERLRGAYTELFDDVDVVLSPTTPTTAFPRGERVDDPLRMYAADVLTTPSSLAGLPGISIPVGRGRGDLPTGVQAVAAPGREDLLFRVAGALERAVGTPSLPEHFA